jgi:hypothetical protein
MILKCLESLYKEVPVKDEEGTVIDVKEVPVKLNFVSLMDVDEEDITAVKQHYNTKGKVYKDRCIINHRYLGNMIIKHKFVDIVKIKQQHKFKVSGYGRR